MKPHVFKACGEFWRVQLWITGDIFGPRFIWRDFKTWSEAVDFALYALKEGR